MQQRSTVWTDKSSFDGAKRGKLEEFGGKRRRLPRIGRKPKSEELEDHLYEWIEEQRGLKLAVTRNAIKARAVNFGFELGLEQFSASNGWLENFINHKGLSLRRATTVCQKPPGELVHPICGFFRYIPTIRKKKDYPLHNVTGQMKWAYGSMLQQRLLWHILMIERSVSALLVTTAFA